MIAWLIILAILVLLVLLPCGIYVRYCAEKTVVRLLIGPFWINLLRPQREKKPAKKQSKQKFESHAKVKEKKQISAYLPILKLVLELLVDFKRKIKINDLQFKMVLGGSDPFTLSVNYGRYWAILGNLMPHLESWFTIKKRNLQIECDYLASSTKVEAAIDLRLPIYILLHMVLHHGIRILVKYVKISKEAKDGAVS